ncbi:3'-5' exonuclease [Neptuniibacter halophilus]|uniref:3'-5' exonuclease n=1 Tax=Neptuniibacter halophilus TaxID=651666 RepID=UPI002572E3F5|nr:3'-5' exonuclease [Neptuniibacter halophilus]
MERPTKEQINELPLFEGMALDNIKLVTNPEESAAAVAELTQCAVVGFDTESKPVFKKGEVSDGPHLIQFSNSEKAFLFPTQFTSTLADIERLLSDPDLKKVGFGLSDDKKVLQRKFAIKIANAEELSTRVKHFTGVKQNVGARAAVAMLLNQRLSKGAQRSNWSKLPLQPHQLKYAANDAYSALLVYMKLEQGESSLS